MGITMAIRIPRIAFGLVMFIGTLRFMAKGWVDEFYVQPHFHFPFFGLEWLRPLPAVGMYTVFVLMLLASLGLTLSRFYRLSAALFFLCFVYVELLDKSFYLNHYYLVSLISFLLILVPADRRGANIIKFQICIVYFFAGISKLTHAWMIDALPLKIWLPAFGGIFKQVWIAYAFSWFGAFFDCTIWIFLLLPRTRIIAYIVVIIFHLTTALLFKIGMFPYIMIAITLVFFSFEPIKKPAPLTRPATTSKALQIFLAFYFLLQLTLPLRYLCYPGNLCWTEQGFRFSWRVMLMEKGGTAFFYLKDARSGRRWEVENPRFLTPLQERQMSTQPDMILQFAHHLHDTYQKKGIADPVITVEDYVTLNGAGSRLYIDSTVDLAKQRDNFLPKKWILPYH
jgi:Vitamin K-dependent gamma-carboxylase